MITTSLGGIAASTWARAILRYGAIAVRNAQKLVTLDQAAV